MTPAQQAHEQLVAFCNAYEAVPLLVTGPHVKPLALAQWIAQHPELARLVLEHRETFEREWEQWR